MSIVLDLVQQIVLHNAYELTCKAAEQVYIKCKKLDDGKWLNCRMLTHKENKPEPPHKPSRADPEEESSPVEEKSKTMTKAKIKKVEYLKRDFPCLNAGPIDPPQSSCMRICRDSYFS